MILTAKQKAVLRTFMESYSFPCVTYDFERCAEHTHSDMLGVERAIQAQLISSRLGDVKDGLSNALYWGYANYGFRRMRVCKFRNGVSRTQLKEVVEIMSERRTLCPSNVARCKLPQFSGIAFVSKVLMFLDPSRFVVLDSKIASLREVATDSLFSDLSVSTTIRPTKSNDAVYENWCQFYIRVGQELGVRAVDVERGRFQMVQSGMGEQAADMCRSHRVCLDGLAAGGNEQAVVGI